MSIKQLLTLTVTFVSLVASAEPAQWPLCSACHGDKGQGGIGPMLAGQSAEYISDRLRAYRDGEYFGEQSPLMWPNAANLTDDDISAIAAFIENIDK